MSNMILISAIAAVVVAGVTIYIVKKQSSKRKVLDISDLKVETTDSELCMDDIVGIFKQQSLKPQEDTPFIARGEEIYDMRLRPKEKLHKEGYDCLFLGSYKEKEGVVSPIVLIFYKSMDEKLKNLMENKKLVVLQ